MSPRFGGSRRQRVRPCPHSGVHADPNAHPYVDAHPDTHAGVVVAVRVAGAAAGVHRNRKHLRRRRGAGRKRWAVDQRPGRRR